MKKNLFQEKNISQIIEGYNNGDINPLDVAESCITQINKFESRFKAWVCFDERLLIKQAEDTKNRIRNGAVIRPLEGIPIGIKDIFNTTDFPTQMGSPIWKGFTPGNDARVIYNIKKAGGLIPGKTVTAEFAVHTLDKTLNPHDTRLTPGSSSSGSAVAVALGMVPIALGTQTAGSIVRPASFCGIYGCKPSFGLIPRTGILKTTDSLDSIGFFALKFIDLKRVFDIIRVDGPDYPLSYKALTDDERQNKPLNRPWQIALVKTHTWQFAPDYAKKEMLKWANQLSSDKNIEVIETELPKEMENSHEIHGTIYDKTLSYYFKEESNSSELVSKIMNDIIKRGNELPIEKYQQALSFQERLCHIMDLFLQRYDAMISLSTAGEAPVRETIEKPDPALMWTMTHLPVISAPVFTSPRNLPFGAQLISRKYNDLLLFKFATYLRSKKYIPDSVNPYALVLEK